jgi:hypothetical protein
MPVSDQDHGWVAMTLAVVLSGLDQALDLCRRQMLAGAQLAVRSAALIYDCALSGFVVLFRQG